MKTWMTGLMLGLAAPAIAQQYVEITSADADGQISLGEYVAYQVRIVNEGSEAAAAFQVRAILHAGLDPAQVYFDWTSHEAALVAQAVDPLTGEIRWLFVGNEAPALVAGEEAFVTFWVVPRAGTAEGTEFDTLAAVEIVSLRETASRAAPRGDPGTEALQGIMNGIGDALNPGFYGKGLQELIDRRSREFQDWSNRTGQQIGDAIKGGLENLMPTENPPKNGKQTAGSCPKKGSGGSGGSGGGGCEAGGSEAGLWLAVLVMASAGLARAIR